MNESRLKKVLAKLKLNLEANVGNALKWSAEEISVMMVTYLKAQSVAKETKNNELLLILNEKIHQLEQAVKTRRKLI